MSGSKKMLSMCKTGLFLSWENLCYLGTLFGTLKWYILSKYYSTYCSMDYTTRKQHNYVTCSGETGNKSAGRCFSFRTYPMHSARHNVNNTHSHSCSAFMSDSFYNSSTKVIEMEFHSFWIGIPWLYRIKIACTVVSYLMRNLSIRLVPCFTRAGHILLFHSGHCDHDTMILGLLIIYYLWSYHAFYDIV